MKSGSNLVLAAVSLVLALSAAEFVMRTFVPVHGMLYELDDRYLFRHIPGARKLASPVGQSWPKVLVRINRSGRRGDESIRTPGVPVVLVYGDSFVAAEFTAERDTYVVQLARALEQRGRQAVVLNAGVSGYGVDQEVVRLEDDLPALRPSLVVIAAYAGNDFGDLLRDKLFRLDGDRLVRNQPAISPDLRREFSAPFFLSSIQLVRLIHGTYETWGPRPERRALVSNVTADRLASRVAEYQAYVVKGDNVVTNLLADEYDADVSLTPRAASAQYRVKLMQRVLERAATLTAAHGARLLLLIIPERCDVAGDCPASADRRSYPEYRPSGLTDALESLAKTGRIASLNLFGPFREHTANALYYPVDEHWNAAGQALAAHLSADTIVDHGLLDRILPKD